MYHISGKARRVANELFIQKKDNGEIIVLTQVTVLQLSFKGSNAVRKRRAA